MINNLMLVQIAVLAWIFVGEALGLLEIGGLAIALVGILFVQLAPVLARRAAAPPEPLPAAPGRGARDGP
ncbi:hypothetical protein BH24CHL6_BH24CHL6_02910 [soil metagenome]